MLTNQSKFSKLKSVKPRQNQKTCVCIYMEEVNMIQVYMYVCIYVYTL